MLRRGLCCSLLSLAVTSSSVAQSNTNLAGDYTGVLTGMHVALHLVANGTGGYSATVDNPSMSAIPCSNIEINGSALSFSVPSLGGSWTGVVSGDGTTLTGVWNQGRPMALNLTRVTGAAASGNAAAMGAAAGTPSSPAASGDVTWDDYVFKFDAER